MAKTGIHGRGKDQFGIPYYQTYHEEDGEEHGFYEFMGGSRTPELFETGIYYKKRRR